MNASLQRYPIPGHRRPMAPARLDESVRPRRSTNGGPVRQVQSTWGERGDGHDGNASFPTEVVGADEAPSFRSVRCRAHGTLYAV